MKYPSDIRPLTSLRFFAAFWLLLYFFWPRLGNGQIARPDLIANGNYGVDLFFILSGFVLAHVYGPMVQNDKYTHKGFMWARFARVYPLHIITLFAMVGIWLLGKTIGAEVPDNAFNVAEIPFHLTLMHAWGYVANDGWNFPSWSISSEWFAYLTFPLTFAISNVYRNNPILGLIFVSILFYALFVFFGFYGIELTNMTWEGGAIRIIPSFLGGIMLWQLGQKNIFNPKYANFGVIASIASIIVVASLGVYPGLIWPLLMALVFFLAETSKVSTKNIMNTKTLVYLGEVSFAMYMVHLPVDIITCKFIEKFASNIHSSTSGGICLMAGLVITFLVAIIAHEFIEKPMRDFLRAKIKFKPRGKNVIIGNPIINR
jgi:peptidoglycan/LPS O-acetylase OafA/YrhL